MASTDGTASTTRAVESALIMNDLSGLSDAERLAYYGRVCESLGLNPLTQPFGYMRADQKLVLYAKRDATDQLRRLHSVSVEILARERLDDLYVVTARTSLPNGRHDESTGVVNLAALRGDALANALMKAETKAKRRATLSICGLGWLDETEVETIPNALSRSSLDQTDRSTRALSPAMPALPSPPVAPAGDGTESPASPDYPAGGLEPKPRLVAADQPRKMAEATAIPIAGIGDAQVRRILQLAEKKGWRQGQADQYAKNVYGVDSIAALTVRQAAEFIQELRS